MQPLLYLLFFGPLLQQIAQTTPGFPAGGAFNVFVPGLLIQIGMFGAAFVGFGLIYELQAGVIERMRVTPISRVAMLFGRSLRDVTILVAQAIFMILLAVPFGLRLDPLAVGVSLGLLALIGLATAPLSYAAALWLKSEDTFAPLVNMVVLPLALLSPFLLPMTLAPDWLQTLARLDPLSYGVTALRAAFNAQFADPAVSTGVGLFVVLAAASLWLASRAFGRANA